MPLKCHLASRSRPTTNGARTNPGPPMPQPHHLSSLGGRIPAHLRQPPFADVLPAPIVFRAVSVPADTVYPRHRHAWGEFVYSFSGVMEIELEKQHYLAPPQYG